MEEIIRGQIGKNADIYSFSVEEIQCQDNLPFMSASFLNSIRRELAQALDEMPCMKKDILCRDLSQKAENDIPQKNVTYKTNVSNKLSHKVYTEAGAESIEKAYEIDPQADAELMRTRYCIRYELGMCPVHHRVKDSGPLFLLNNGRRLALHFDCRNCEMTVTLP
jgi:putative protease